MQFVLTRAHPERSSRSVTHPEIAPGQARLTLEFFRDWLPEKKLQLVDMSILSILLSPWAGVSHPHPLKRPTSSSVNLKSGTSSLGHVPYVQCQRRIPDARALTRHAPVHMPVASAPPRARAHAHALLPVCGVKPRESALIPFYNVSPPRGQARLHLAAF